MSFLPQILCDGEASKREFAFRRFYVEGCGHKIISYYENRSSLRSTSQEELPLTDIKYVETILNDTVWKDANGNPYIYPPHHTGREASHIIKVNGAYYWFSSGLDGWKSTQTKYATSTALSGPWSELNILPTEPVSRDSFNKQHDFVIPVIGGEASTYVYVGNSYSRHHGCGVGRNIFLPLIWEDGRPTLKWHRSWRIDAAEGHYLKEEISLQTKMK